MNFDATQLEGELKKLTPTDLPDSLLDRLDLAMSDAAAEVAPSGEKIILASPDHQLAALEERLQDLVPFGMPEDMISRLDEAMSRWHEEVPVEEKVVAIHPEVVKKRSSWVGFRSAAAVGLLGAGLAFMTGGSDPAAVADSQRIPVLTHGSTTPVVFTSNDARASLISANDHGVIWTKEGKPVRCTEVRLTHRLQFVNEAGETLILEQPKREVRFTPVKFD